MKIVNLIENIDAENGCSFEHGLSFYVETPKHKLLVDTGATGAFADNARCLGVDLTQVDTLILSHGHYDHGGGILAFAALNSHAKIYIRESALNDYYSIKEDGPKYIGLDSQIASLSQVVFVKEDMVIDEELSLFTNVTGRKLWPSGNKVLKCKKDGELVQDDFDHEQYLIIQCEGQEILISGCAHNGIINILDRYEEIRHRQPDMVISGFHMMKKSGYEPSDVELIRGIAETLTCYKTKFYTGHCTGVEAYDILKEIMGNQMQYVKSGEEISDVLSGTN